MFSLEQLLFAIANDQRSNDETVKKMLPMLKEVYEMEKTDRQALKVKLMKFLKKKCLLTFNILF